MNDHQERITILLSSFGTDDILPAPELDLPQPAMNNAACRASPSYSCMFAIGIMFQRISGARGAHRFAPTPKLFGSCDVRISSAPPRSALHKRRQVALPSSTAFLVLLDEIFILVRAKRPAQETLGRNSQRLSDFRNSGPDAIGDRSELG
jgi:hypothetical protein